MKKSSFYHTLCIRRPSEGGSRRNIATPFGTEKLEWWGYPKVKNFDDMYNRLGKIPACDRQTDGQTDGHLAMAYTRYVYASRSKNREICYTTPVFSPL